MQNMQTVSAASSIPDMNQIVGSHDIVFITLDTLRYDVAQQLFMNGELPVLAPYLAASGWEKRHTPGSFTYAAHHAFFAGFLPTPAYPGHHPRLFATAFRGSETTSSNTCVFSQENIVAGLAARGYHSICIGGVGFFNQQTALGSVLPSLFAEAHWNPSLGVGSPRSTQQQVKLACRQVQAQTGRVFLFINISAIHHPNHFYLRDDDANLVTPELANERSRNTGQSRRDSLDSHAAAMRYVDGALAPLMQFFSRRGPSFFIVCSDHGCAYGEDGFTGHRLAHDSVWNVPYAHFCVQGPT